MGFTEHPLHGELEGAGEIRTLVLDCNGSPLLIVSSPAPRVISGFRESQAGYFFRNALRFLKRFPSALLTARTSRRA